MMMSPETAEQFERFAEISLGEQRGHPRVYLNGKYLLRAGFAPARLIEAEFSADRLVIRLSESGSRRVSVRGDGVTPVIDINNPALAAAFGENTALLMHVAKGEIVITPHVVESNRRRRARNGKERSNYSGGGLMTLAAKKAGFTAASANEIEEQYAAIYEANHPEATMYRMSVSDVPLRDLPRFDTEVYTAGIPCDPFAQPRTLERGGVNVKRDRSLPPEAHELGDMVFWTLRMIDHLQPYSAVIEESPNFLKSGAGFILLHALRRMGYAVEARVLRPTDFGYLTGRPRAIIVATTDAEVKWPKPRSCASTIGDILDADYLTADRWFTRESKPWVFNHWDAQAEKGNGFGGMIVRPSDRQVGTIKKRYLAGQGDNPVLQHPTDPEKFSWFTLPELKRLHGVDDGYDLGAAKVTGGEVVGQGVHVGLLAQVIAAATGRDPDASVFEAPVAAEACDVAAELEPGAPSYEQLAIF